MIPAQFEAARLADFDELPAAATALIARLHADGCKAVRTIKPRFHYDDQKHTGWLDCSRALPGLFIAGPVGAGKSHLAAAIVHDATAYAASGSAAFVPLFVDAPEMIQAARDAVSYSLPRPDELRDVHDADLVVLDDVTGIRPTDFAVDTVSGIIRYRYNRELLTILTANADVPELLPLFGEQIVSRLHQMCDFVEMAGADRRRA